MTAYTGNTVTTTPTIATATSVTILAANPNRKFLLIQNASAADICINTEGAALTGVVPSATNKAICLKSTAGANVLRFEGMYVPAGAITAYQSSGASINTVVVVEG